MTEPDIVAELDDWISRENMDDPPGKKLKRARAEILALRDVVNKQWTGVEHGKYKARAEALEEAAKIADDAWDPLAAAIARDIRSLKDQSECQGDAA